MELRQADGVARQRDIAQALGVTEGMLIDAQVDVSSTGVGRGLQARRLQGEHGDFGQLLSELGRAGELTAVTRHAHCMHERTGVYELPGVYGDIGRAEADQRLFYSHWVHGYAVRDGAQQSFQFFDAQGVAVHQVFAGAATQMAAWQALCMRWVDANVGVDAEASRAGGPSLRGAQEFFGQQRRHGLPRIRAMELVAPAFAQPVDRHAARVLLQGAATNGTPIMVLVGSPGVMQIHAGRIRRVEVAGPWLHVLDPRFSLHLREDAIAHAWAVRTPTADGLISSLALYAQDGELIAQFFGQRQPGQPERCAWRELLHAQVDDRAWREEAVGCAA